MNIAEADPKLLEQIDHAGTPELSHRLFVRAVLYRDQRLVLIGLDTILKGLSATVTIAEAVYHKHI